jgi:hypothetical protein
VTLSRAATSAERIAEQQFKRWLTTVDYKPGWSFEMLDRDVHGVPAVRFKMLVWDTFAVRDLFTIVVTTDYTLFLPLQSEFDETEARQFIRNCVHIIEGHEADEWLRFDGEQAFNPHGDPQMLGRRVEGWEWMGPQCFQIAETLQQKGSHGTPTAHRRVPEIPELSGARRRLAE